MVRHMTRQVVKLGHFKEYLVATRAWNEAAVKAGLPAYRYYASNWGTANEVFADAEFADSADIERRFEAVESNAELSEATKSLISHYVDGEGRDWVLSDLSGT